MAKKDVHISYCNNFVFKKTYAGNDDDSKFVLKFAVEAVTGEEYEEIEVTNSELLGDYMNTKDHFLDIKAKDKNGELINIEMQQSYVNRLQRCRIQMYAARTLSNQEIKGERYDALKRVEQIIFTTKNYNDQMYTRYVLKDQEGNEMPDCLIVYHIVSIPCIKKVLEEKKGGLSDLELLCYIYDKGVDDDIMELANQTQKKVLNIMDDKLKRIMKNEEELGFAVTEEYWQVEKEFYGQDERREGRAEGKAEGRIEGKAEGRAEGENYGLAKSVILLMQSKFKLSDDIKQMIYKLSNEILERIIIHNQQINSEEELKRFIKSFKE